MTRRFGASPQSDIRYRFRPGVYAVLPLGGRLLVTHQATPVAELQLPGGGVEPGEHPLHALHREILEETGWQIARPRRIGAFRRFAYMPDYDLWAEKLCVIYHARPVRRLGPPSEPGHRAVWISPAQAVRELGNEGDRHFVSQAVALT